MKRKWFGRVLLGLALLLSGMAISYASNGGNPTVSSLGLYNFPWFNATVGFSTPGTLDTGQGAYELYGMDQDVLTTSDVNFSSVESDGFAYQGVDKSDLFAYPQQPASYIVWKEGSTYYAKNGTTGQIDFSGNNASTIINLAIAQRGGVIHLSGLYSGVAYYDLTGSIIDGGQDNVVLEGEGENTILRMADNTIASNIRVEEQTGWIIRDLTIDGNKVNNPNSQGPAPADMTQNGITFKTVTHSKIIRVHLHHTVMHGINIWYDSTDNQVTDCYVHDCGEAGGYDVQGGILVYLRSLRNTVSRNRIENNYKRGIYCANEAHENIFEENIVSGGEATDNQGIYIFDEANNNMVSGNLILGLGGLNHAIDIIPYEGKNPLHTTIANNKIISPDGYGIRCYSDYSIIEGNHIYNSSGPGIRTASPSILVCDNVVLQSGQYGLYVSSDDCTIESNLLINNTLDGILLDGVKDTQILGNQITENVNYGIRILNSGCERTRVFQNRLTDNAYGAILDSGTDTEIKYNAGFITEKEGTATLVNGNVAIVVNHGCDYTPSAGDIQTHPIKTLNNADFWWVDTITATQFTIHTDQDPSADVDFAWSVNRH